MAKSTARNTVIHILDSTSASRNISGRSNSVTMSFTADSVDVTGFGAIYRQYIADGIKEWNMSVNGVWDGAASNLDEIMNGVLGACTSMCYCPSGSSTGAIQYSGCAVVTEYSVEGVVSGAVTWSGTFQSASDLNRGTCV